MATVDTGLQSYRSEPLDIFEFSRDLGQKTSMLFQEDLLPIRKTITIKRRSKSHTRHILENMNSNGIDYQGYLRCCVKTPPSKGRYIPNLKCYMNESAKALFLSDCDNNSDASLHYARRADKKKKRIKKAEMKSNSQQKTIHKSTKSYKPPKQQQQRQKRQKHTPNKSHNRSKSPSTIPLDPHFDNPIISDVLDDLIVKGQFDAQFEDLFCSTFTSSQNL